MNDRLESSDPPEFPHPVDPAELGAEPCELSLRPDRAQLALLARRFELIALDRLAAAVELQRQPNGDILATGVIDADVVQRCVVTLEPVKNRVRASFRRLYVAGADAELGVGEEQDWEPLADSIDAGELVAQEFGLALDPFPRAPGAALDQPAATDPLESPFAALHRTRR